MNENIELTSGKWLLIIGQRKIIPTLLKMVGRLAEAGLSAARAAESADGGMKPPRPAVRVIDGGMRYDTFLVGMGAKHKLEVVERVSVYQANNCHEMLAALERIPAGPEPFVVLDFLQAFLDPFVWGDDRKRLLRGSLKQLDRLAKGSSGLVSVHMPRVLSQMEDDLLKMVTGAAEDMYHVEMAPPGSVAVRFS